MLVVPSSKSSKLNLLRMIRTGVLQLMEGMFSPSGKEREATLSSGTLFDWLLLGDVRLMGAAQGKIKLNEGKLSCTTSCGASVVMN